MLRIAQALLSISSSQNVYAVRTTNEGHLINPMARFPITFQGDTLSALESLDIEVIVDHDTFPDLLWTEGPLWIEEQSSLFFAEVKQGIIYRYNVQEDIVIPWAIHTGGVDPSQQTHLDQTGSNGMARDTTDPSMVYICQHYQHRIIKCQLMSHEPGKPLESCPGFEVICSTDNNGKPFNSPNDITVDPNDGSVWFSDPIYGLLEKSRYSDEWTSTGSYLEEKSYKERTGINGVYRVDPKSKKVELVSSFQHRPNGLAFHNNELWVADSTTGVPSWTCYPLPYHSNSSSCENDYSLPKFPLQANQVVTSATLGANLGFHPNDPNRLLLGSQGLSDGLNIDKKGNMWTSIPNGFAVIDLNSKPQPKLICQILLGINTSNVAFGSNNDIWLTGRKGVWRVKAKF